MLNNSHVSVRFLSRLGALSLLTFGLVVGSAVAPATAVQAVPAGSVFSASAIVGSASSGASLRSAGSYVALGDSFTSGQGAPPYSNEACKRSTYKSYPVIASVISPYRLSANKACSGASIAAVAGQLAGVSPSTALVTITVGGIDAGSNQVLAACTDPTSALCAATVAASSATIASLGPSLVAAYATVAATLPYARIAVLGYPRLFHPGVAPLGDLVNAGTDALNAVIKGSVSATGNARIGFVDVSQEFAGHGIGSSVPYISFNPANPLAAANFHPNVLGNGLGYARALANDGVLRRP
ncbi:lysophospholipase L1-like esterase [Mycetocola sp. CAN_C7]|uniref:SGNH/GDSL hydrolase family protein n=1 Tax=Mycetocola sp. CAN_C7 TaxID=2787724 RepID=UPI0018CA637A